MKAPAFKIYCDMEHSEFTLAQEGKSWREKFTDLEAALAFASNAASESTRLDVYNTSGKMIIKSTVDPILNRGATESWSAFQQRKSKAVAS